MDNWLGSWFKPCIDQGLLTIGLLPATKLQMIAVPDIGKYGLLGFEQHAELNGKALDIAGDELTMPETAKIISQAIGKEITFAPTPIEEVRNYSADFAAMLDWFNKVGYNADIKGNEKTYGIKATSFSEWAKKQSWK